MSILIRGWKMEDWEELVKMARIGANNAMLGVNTVVEELPPHGDLIDRDVAYDKIAEQEGGNYVDMDAVDMGLSETPVIIPEDDAWPEWRTQVLGIRRQEEE